MLNSLKEQQDSDQKPVFFFYHELIFERSSFIFSVIYISVVPSSLRSKAIDKRSTDHEDHEREAWDDALFTLPKTENRPSPQKIAIFQGIYFQGLCMLVWGVAVHISRLKNIFPLLKLTVRTCQEAVFPKGCYILQPQWFRCFPLVSGSGAFPLPRWFLSKMWMLPSMVVPPSHPILIGVFHINHPFWGFPPFLETRMSCDFPKPPAL